MTFDQFNSFVSGMCTANEVPLSTINSHNILLINLVRWWLIYLLESYIVWRTIQLDKQDFMFILCSICWLWVKRTVCLLPADATSVVHATIRGKLILYHGRKKIIIQSKFVQRWSFQVFDKQTLRRNNLHATDNVSDRGGGEMIKLGSFCEGYKLQKCVLCRLVKNK